LRQATKSIIVQKAAYVKSQKTFFYPNLCGVKRYDPNRGTRTLKSGKEAGAQVFLRPLDCHRAHDQLSVKDTEGAAEGRLSLTDS